MAARAHEERADALNRVAPSLIPARAARRFSVFPPHRGGGASPPPHQGEAGVSSPGGGRVFGASYVVVVRPSDRVLESALSSVVSTCAVDDGPAPAGAEGEEENRRANIDWAGCPAIADSAPPKRPALSQLGLGCSQLHARSRRREPATGHAAPQQCGGHLSHECRAGRRGGNRRRREPPPSRAERVGRDRPRRRRESRGSCWAHFVAVAALGDAPDGAC